METTYSNMTVEHLGSDATERDLLEFQEACRSYMAGTGVTEAEATDYVWNEGDFGRRVQEWA